MFGSMVVTLVSTPSGKSVNRFGNAGGAGVVRLVGVTSAIR
jgi:hypothetical protein